MQIIKLSELNLFSMDTMHIKSSTAGERLKMNYNIFRLLFLYVSNSNTNSHECRNENDWHS